MLKTNKEYPAMIIIGSFLMITGEATFEQVGKNKELKLNLQLKEAGEI